MPKGVNSGAPSTAFKPVVPGLIIKHVPGGTIVQGVGGINVHSALASGLIPLPGNTVPLAPTIMGLQTVNHPKQATSKQTVLPPGIVNIRPLTADSMASQVDATCDKNAAGVVTVDPVSPDSPFIMKVEPMSQTPPSHTSVVAIPDEGDIEPTFNSVLSGVIRVKPIMGTVSAATSHKLPLGIVNVTSLAEPELAHKHYSQHALPTGVLSVKPVITSYSKCKVSKAAATLPPCITKVVSSHMKCPVTHVTMPVGVTAVKTMTQSEQTSQHTVASVNVENDDSQTGKNQLEIVNTWSGKDQPEDELMMKSDDSLGDSTSQEGDEMERPLTPTRFTKLVIGNMTVGDSNGVYELDSETNTNNMYRLATGKHMQDCNTMFSMYEMSTNPRPVRKSKKRKVSSKMENIIARVDMKGMKQIMLQFTFTQTGFPEIV